jgi:hypothetical protein
VLYRHWTRVESDRIALVAADAGTFHGCLRALGRWHYLEADVPPSGQGYTQVTVTALAIAGRYTLLKSDESNQQYPADYIEYDVFDVANGHQGEIANGNVIEAVISTRGSLAVTRVTLGANGAATESLLLGGSFRTLDVAQLGTYADYGVIGHLRFHGQTLTWTDHGRPRSAHVAV